MKISQLSIRLNATVDLSAFGRGCPLWWKSVSSLIPNLSIIGNVSKSTSILILNGENDSQTPVG